jgi:hypothetical protein
METEPRCINCNSRRRSVYRAKYCKKCYPWYVKAGRLKQQRSDAPREKLHQVSYPERVLEEYAWRERNLDAPDVDPIGIIGLVWAVTAECRSEIPFALHSYFNSQTPETRKCVYLLFLTILENLPYRTPRLRMGRAPLKGRHRDFIEAMIYEKYRPASSGTAPEVNEKAVAQHAASECDRMP